MGGSFLDDAYMSPNLLVSLGKSPAKEVDLSLRRRCTDFTLKEGGWLFNVEP